MTNTSENRVKAINIVNSHLESMTGLCLSDLPDTCEVADIIDEVEEALDDHPNNPRVREILLQMDLEWIYRLIME